MSRVLLNAPNAAAIASAGRSTDRYSGSQLSVGSQRLGKYTTRQGLSIAVPYAANDNNPMDARFARGGAVLERGFGGDGEDLLGRLEADDTFEGRDGVLAVGCDEFRDLVSGLALFLNSRVGQLLADVLGLLDDHAD